MHWSMAAALGKRFGNARPETKALPSCYAGGMAFSRARILESLARLRFIDAGESTRNLDDSLTTRHRALSALHALVLTGCTPAVRQGQIVVIEPTVLRRQRGPSLRQQLYMRPTPTRF